MSQPKPENFFQFDTPLPGHASSYVSRPGDEALMQAILAGRYCHILAGHGQGKSSLLAHTRSRLPADTHAVILTGDAADNLNQWYLNLLRQFKQELNLRFAEAAWTHKLATAGLRSALLEFLRQVVLEQTSHYIILFVDDFEIILEQPFAPDFLAVIHTAHAAHTTDLAYKRLTFILCGIVLPTDLLTPPRPAKIVVNRPLTAAERARGMAATSQPVTPPADLSLWTAIALNDFTLKEAATLQKGLELLHPEQAPDILKRILYWSDGQPYLTQKLCAETAAGEWSAAQTDALVERLFGIEADPHLKAVRAQLDRSAEMLHFYRQLLDGKTVVDRAGSEAASRLKLLGLVKATPAGELTLRNRIYARVFDRAWVEGQTERTSTPFSPSRFMVAAIAGMILAVCVVLLAGASAAAYLLQEQPTPDASPTRTVMITATLTSTPTLAATVVSASTPALTATVVSASTPPLTATLSLTSTPPLTATLSLASTPPLTTTVVSASTATKTPEVAAATSTPSVVVEPSPTPSAILTSTLSGRIAFPVDDNVGNYDVWVIVLPDGEPFTVFDQARQPNFGPDGRLLVNSENIPRGEHIGLIGTGYDWQGVVSDSPYDSHPFWSSDGSRYVYANDHLLFSPLFPDQYASYIFIPCSLRRPAVEETEEKCQDTRGQSKLVAGAYPVWTEDNRIAFTYYEAAEDGIYIVQANSVAREMAYGETPKPLVFGNGRASDTRGNQLFFSAGSLDQNWEAYAINLDGSNLINISNSPGTQDGLPTISPDGKWVAFVSDRDNHWGIWAVSIAGGPPVELVDLRRINTNPSPWGVGDREWITERISWGP